MPLPCPQRPELAFLLKQNKTENNMKKLILSTLAVASLAFAAYTVINMCVKTKDGKVVEFDVENVEEAYYKESSESITDQGVTVSGKEGLYTYVDLSYRRSGQSVRSVLR